MNTINKVENFRSVSENGYWACKYAMAGLKVFPVYAPDDPEDDSFKGHRGKKPIGTLVPNGCKDATYDIDKIIGWWTQIPNANIGICMGASGLIGIDIDGPKGEESLQKLIDEFGPLPDGVWIATTARGRHLYFQASEGADILSRAGWREGIDIRCGNTYLIAPPSQHESGAQYQWENPPDLTQISQASPPHPSPLPESWLIALPRRVVTSGEPKAGNASPETALERQVVEWALPPATVEEIRRCKECVERCQPAILGQGGHNQTYHIARIIYHNFGLSPEEGNPLFDEYNQRCLPPWSEAELAHKRDDAMSKPGKRPRGWCRYVKDDPGNLQEGDYCPETGKYLLDPTRTRIIAIRFLQQHFTDRNGLRLLHYADGRFWGWRDNKYIPFDEDRLCSLIIEFLTHRVMSIDDHPSNNSRRKRNTFPANARTAKNIMDDMKGYIALTPGQINGMWIGDGPSPHDPKTMLFCPNRNYDYMTDTLCNCDPRYFNRSTIAVDYDPNASPPTAFITFVQSLFGDDQEATWALLEYFGYALTNDTSLQKGLFLCGPPRSGKGTLIRLLADLLGVQSVCSLQTAAFSSEFGLQNLLGKLLLIISDARFAGKKVNEFIETILNIIGEDMVQVNQKHKDLVSARLLTRLFIAANEVPYWPDASGAIVNRFLAIRLTRSHVGHEDFGLEAKLNSELPGILKYCIKGLKRLRKRGRFHQPKSGECILRDMASIGNPLKNFIEESCTLGPELSCPCQTLYHYYKKWCDDNGERATTDSVFGKNLRAAFPEIARRQGSDGKREYHGIAMLTVFTPPLPSRDRGGGDGGETPPF